MPRGRKRKDAFTDQEVSLQGLRPKEMEFEPATGMHCYGKDSINHERNIERLVTQRTTSTCPSELTAGNHTSDLDDEVRAKYWKSSTANSGSSDKNEGIVSEGNNNNEDGPDRGVPLWETSPTLTLTAPGFGLLDPRSAFPEGRVVGVYFDKQRRIWRANWREGGVGKRKTKNFSVDDYGFEEARRLAIEYRLLKIMEVSDKQLGGGAAAMEQAAYLHAELKRKKGADAKGKRRRCYALSNNSFTKRSSYLEDEYHRVAPGTYAGTWGALGDLGSPVTSSQQDDVYAVRALQWRSWDYQMALQLAAASSDTYGVYDTTSYIHHQMWQQQGPRTPPLCFEGQDVSDGTVATSSMVVTARPIDEDFDVTFPSSSSTDNHRADFKLEDGNISSLDNGIDTGCRLDTGGHDDQYIWEGAPYNTTFHHHNLTGLTHDDISSLSGV